MFENVSQSKKMSVLQTFSFFNGTLVLEIEYMIVFLLLVVMAVFGWCIVGMALQRELLLFVSEKYFENKNVLLVIAHPDDESMFFSPLLSFLERRHYSDNTHILSLSNGGNDARSKELKAAGMRVFGIRKKRIQIKDFKDGMNEDWNTRIILEYIQQYVKENDIEILFTFDGFGVSGHPNHCSIYKALANNLNSLQLTDVYSLRSVSICRKYSMYFKALLCLLICVPFNWNLCKCDFAILSAPNKCWDGMIHHKSQFVWFRKLFVVFSRYSWINEFDQITPEYTGSTNKKRL